MAENESPVAMAERHVHLAESHVARQLEIIAELRRGGHPTEDAEDLLKTFEQALASHRQHLEVERQELRDSL